MSNYHYIFENGEPVPAQRGDRATHALVPIVGFAEESLNVLASRAWANSVRWFPHQAGWSEHETLAHYALGAAEEAGEVAGVVKKHTAYLADDPKRRGLDELAGEITDALTYLLALAGYLGLDLGAAWDANVAKCEERWG